MGAVSRELYVALSHQPVLLLVRRPPIPGESTQVAGAITITPWGHLGGALYLARATSPLSRQPRFAYGCTHESLSPHWPLSTWLTPLGDLDGMIGIVSS
jgi:hypothetical protein